MAVSQKNSMKRFGITLKYLSFCHLKWLNSKRGTKYFSKTACNKDRNKRFIKNWRPISLLNVNVTLISKVLSNQIKKTHHQIKFQIIKKHM